jgi:hypothetical protein
MLMFTAGLYSQEPETIRIKKESNLVKAVLDNTDDKLVVMDRFGNPRENEIVSYRLWVKAKKETREFRGYGNRLSPEMVNYLNKLGSATKIFFTEISAKEDDEHIVKLPDVIETWFPDCKNCDPRKTRR